MASEQVVLVLIMVGLTLYTVLGGADFGAGVWEFITALGKTERERSLIYRAVGPVWEANHVWLIFVVVGLHTGFPRAFAAASQALWVPLSLATVGIVFRGVSFVFRSYAAGAVRERAYWGAVFALASTAAPFFLGGAIGAVASGRLAVTATGDYKGIYLTGWISPLSVFTAFYAVGLCAYLAAVYLIREAAVAGAADLVALWRRRALGVGVVAGVLSAVGLAYVAAAAPGLWDGFRARAWPLVAASVALGVFSLIAVWNSWHRTSVAGAATTVATVVWGWAAAQFPLIIPPTIHIASAKAPDAVLRAMVWSIAAGSLLIGPSLGFLFYLFKGKRPEEDPMQDTSPAGMNLPQDQAGSDAVNVIDEDVKTLHSLGYGQELLRRMSGFSNFAISMSIICILAGCITSFAEGFSRVGGAAIGLGWPLGCLISLCLALTMAQVASAFPTAGGLYHWASILGGRGWGWTTAWFNLAGLITVLAAINVGTYEFVAGAFRLPVGGHPEAFKILAVAGITFSQAMFNHRGIRITTLLTDFSGYLILIVAVALTVAMLVSAGGLELSRLVTFTNYSGPAGGDVVPASGSMAWLFLLGLLLPAYTVTGYDASAHTAEETVGAAHHVPRGIVRSVLVSGIFGWVMLSAVVLAAPSMNSAAAQGKNAFAWIMQNVLNPNVSLVLSIGIAVAQYLCGLATVTSASRMVYAFARDGGLPFSGALRRVSPRSLTPSIAIWTVAFLAVAFTIYAKAYSVITAAAVIFLYISYVIPAALGFFAYGRTWTKMGPWDIGAWYRVLAVLSVIGCGLLLVVCVWPPNDLNLTIVGVSLAVLAVTWFAFERHRFQGPPEGLMIQRRQAEIQAEEQKSGVLDRIRSRSE